MNIENTQSQMRKGILEFCILSVIRRGEAYPSDIVEEMRAANLQILEGTLYPLAYPVEKCRNANVPLGRKQFRSSPKIFFPDRKRRKFL